MKKTRWIMAAFMAAALAGIAPCGSGCKENASSPAAVKYTCGMHPEVVRDQPGKRPKCGMDLVEKK